ncbi:MAG: diguanylate cyclase [Zavarzinia sp.]|nr:diguanylate cyclase [Zavarzinia sp.]
MAEATDKLTLGGRRFRPVAIVAAVIFAAALLGILTRPLGFLAAFWPANALLLGMMVRFPALNTRWGWLGALAGYLAADWLTGGAFFATLWLTATNMAMAGTGVALYARLGPADRRLERPVSVLHLFVICVAGAAVATGIGCWANPLFFDRELVSGLGYWFSAELVNAISVVPVVLTLPTSVRGMVFGLKRMVTDARFAAPAVGVLLSVIGALVVGGPGAIAFPVPALLWCALYYGVFGTVILTMLTTGFMLVAVSAGWLPDIGTLSFMRDTLSVRAGTTLLALGPLMVASINVAREDALRRLDHAASHDSLTGVLNRMALLREGEALMDRGGKAAVLIFDIDHFKQVNDVHGHAAGDVALATLARAVAAGLRENDVFGRLGGEEFVALLPGFGLEAGVAVAERLRRRVAETPIELGARTLHVTVSIGVAAREVGANPMLAFLMSRADRALYQAKAEGRDRVVGAD